MTSTAWSTVLTTIGGQYKERWPDEESRIIFHSTVLTYSQRLTALTFMYGNIRDVDIVYAALLPHQIGVEPRSRDHAQRFLADLASGKYDLKYHYFDVHAADWFFFSGAVNARRSPPSQLARSLHAWDAECMRIRRAEKRWPTLAEQRAFVGM